MDERKKLELTTTVLVDPVVEAALAPRRARPVKNKAGKAELQARPTGDSVEDGS